MKRAIVLCAGLGTRMRPHSQRVPKPVLRIRDTSPLLQHLLELNRQGYEHTVVTCSYQSQTLRLITRQWQFDRMTVSFSHEGYDPIDTAGGIKRALMGHYEHAVTVLNGDVWTDFPLNTLAPPPPEGMHLVLTDNPPHHPNGDFQLGPDGKVQLLATGNPSLTFTGISSLHPGVLSQLENFRGLGDLIRHLVARQSVTAQTHFGTWFDVGTPDRLATVIDQKPI